MAYFAIMKKNVLKTEISNSQTHANMHYENFPIASFILPKRLREPIALIYSFARQADDFADEGDLSPQQRLELLDGFRSELDLIKAHAQPKTDFFYALNIIIQAQNLPLQSFYDLLNAFSQDVVKSRYINFGEIIDYSRRSANPVGRLLLHLYGAATTKNISYSDAICSALQIINFIQDIAIDIKKDRIYMPQDELARFKITENDIIYANYDYKFKLFMEFQIERARKLLQSGAPIGLILTGRIGLEMRLIIAGGERILAKLHKIEGDIFNNRPILNKLDYLKMLKKALFRK